MGRILRFSGLNGTSLGRPVRVIGPGHDTADQALFWVVGQFEF